MGTQLAATGGFVTALNRALNAVSALRAVCVPAAETRPDTGEMMRLTILGSASGISMPGRGHAAVALEAGAGLYLFDLGEPVGRSLLALGLPLENLRAAFISHMHSDHCGGLPQFVKNLHLYHNHPEYLPQVDRIALALPSEAVEAVKAFMGACYMFSERLAVTVEYLGVKEGFVYDDGEVTVRAHPTTHMEQYRPLVTGDPSRSSIDCQSFSFEAERGGRRTLYSGDVGSVEDLLPIAAGVDVLVLEFGHLLPLEENLKRLADLGIGRIIVTHIFPDYNDETGRLQELADSAVPGLVTVAEDGLVIELPVG
ncbi:MAG: MBL fold metallo-hydrolase [Planctomycetota bacterium]|jgi:ribonuclease Z